MREAGSHLDHGVEDEVDHQGQAAAVAIGHQSKDERAHGTEHQGKRDGESNLCICAVKFLSDGGQREDDQEEVEGVERPSEEPGEYGGPVAAFGRRNGWRSGLRTRVGFRHSIVIEKLSSAAKRSQRAHVIKVLQMAYEFDDLVGTIGWPLGEIGAAMKLLGHLVVIHRIGRTAFTRYSGAAGCYFLPTAITTNEFGNGIGRPRGFSALGFGAGPRSAVTVSICPVLASNVMVRAPFLVGTFSISAYFPSR